MSEWQPIETAPKDGTLIVGLTPTGAGHPYYMYPYIMRHSDKLYGSWEYNNGRKWVNWGPDGPTHWSPLPAPPTK